MCDNFNLKKWIDIHKIHGTYWLLEFFYLVLETLFPRVDL